MAMTMRDAFWNELYKITKADKDVILIISDMGAPALDKFKLNLPNQLVNVGIAEQNAILIATGLALTGKKPYVYSISSFLTTRCFEQIKLYLAGMHLPITLVGVGAGICYAESGPTHHALEDVATFRTLPQMSVLNITDNALAAAAARISYNMKTPCYVRLDRIVQPDIYAEGTAFEDGIGILEPIQKINIVSTGNMVHTALNIRDQLRKYGEKIGIVDIYKFPIDPEYFINKIGDTEIIISLEEHCLPGGLGSNICEIVIDHDLKTKVKRFGMDLNEGYCYTYGGREIIHKEYGIDADNLTKYILEMEKE